MRIHPVFCLFFYLLSPVYSDEDFYQIRSCCAYNGPHFEDLEYVIVARFNKHKMLEYNSTRGNWIGFTPYSIKASGFWNRDPFDALQRKFEEKLMCQDNLHFIQALGNWSSAPTVKITLVKEASVGHPAMLVCSAYDFYPKQIRMKWQRNEQEVTAGVSYSDEMDDGDLYYQIHSFLEYTPSSGETITCVVEHYALSEPKIVIWNNSLPAKAQIQIIMGLCGLIFGLLIVSSGLIYYKKKSAAFITFCQGRTLIPAPELEQL